ncbi:hypothetical protein BP5796_12161 [Coleophoma crateriformis]|uniref:ASST-domain-containing protein n=1 Tax=Coleophoma crateriformis TaxID=565419 RepID=A0A3D8QC05_9HELO|nr:hypothetical protein BP5796_12161 [Coleophoma crateriformis]
MKAISNLLLAVASILPFAFADWRYKSRPDLTPPTLNISIPATTKVDQGYLFVQPYSSFEGPRGGPVQPAAYILRNDGDLVWSSLTYFSAWIGNFQAKKWKGLPVLTAFEGSLDSMHGHGYGHVTLLDQNYDVVKVVRGGNHRLISIHEATIINEETLLVEVYQPVARDLSAYGGSKDMQWIAEGIFQEVNIETGELLFEWHSLDHVDGSESAIPLSSGRAFLGVNSTDAWDYFHINSVDKNAEGDYLVSARHTSTIYKINGTSGQVIWRLGGKSSDFVLLKDLKFGYQHDARFRHQSTDGEITIISFFDNSARSDAQRGGGLDSIRNHSSARIVMLNTTDFTASEIKTLASPDGILNPSQGNVQILPNGNTFVGWGQAGAISEFSSDEGEPIFHAYLESGLEGVGTQSYRAFRYNWTGTPHETPAIVAQCDGVECTQKCNGETTIYVSWNGDTETTKWRFYSATGPEGAASSTAAKINYLGESLRTSFETSLRVPTPKISSCPQGVVFAEAINSHGHVIVTSRLAPIEIAIHPMAELKDKKVGLLEQSRLSRVLGLVAFKTGEL